MTIFATCQPPYCWRGHYAFKQFFFFEEEFWHIVVLMINSCLSNWIKNIFAITCTVELWAGSTTAFHAAFHRPFHSWFQMWRRKSKKLAGKGSTLISTGKGNKRDRQSLMAAASAASVLQVPPKPSAASKTSKASAAVALPVASGEDTPQSPVKVWALNIRTCLVQL